MRPLKYTLDSMGIHAPIATKSGKSTWKSRILSLSKNTRISGLHPDPVVAKILSERKINSNFTEKLKTLF
jgi:hypothetical protein